MKKIIITLVVVAAIIGIYFLVKSPKGTDTAQDTIPPVTVPTTTQSTTNPRNTETESLGTSVQGRDITAYHYGTGPTELLVIGGIHGGYEWNTALVAQELVSYLKQNPSAIPSDVKVTVIPVMNPDGLNKVVGTTTGTFSQSDVAASQTTQIAGRFNGNKVDLNRNFDCGWQASGTWQNTTVSGGTSVFSEPESQAIKTYVEKNKPAAVLVYYSAAGGVYASSCSSGVSTETSVLTKTYADASGYPAHASFDSYPTSGDMTNWLAKIGIPTISVLLTNHTDTEWTKNLAGVQALLAHLAK